MAATTLFCLYPPSLRRPQRHLRPPSIRTSNSDLLGDFGSRDPFPAELASNFGDKVLGNKDTEHKILIPTTSALLLSQQPCAPVSTLQSPMPKSEAQKMLLKVVGWRLMDEGERLKLQCVLKLRDWKCGVELVNRVAKVAETAGHWPGRVEVEGKSHQVKVELWTEEVGGLSMNDFVLAATIDEIRTSDLIPRKRVWA